MSARTLSASLAALSTTAVYRSRSDFNRRKNAVSTASPVRGLDAAIRLATSRTRSASGLPSIRQQTNRRRADRLALSVTLMGSSQLPGGFFGQAAMVLRRQYLPRHHGCCPHDELAHVPFQIREHAGTFAVICGARTGHNLLGMRRRVRDFHLAGSHGGDACLFDELIAERVGARQYRAPLGVDLGQLATNLLGVGQARGDLLAARLEEPQDRFVGKQLQKHADDPETDHLRHQMRPVDPERACDFFHDATSYPTR